MTSLAHVNGQTVPVITHHQSAVITTEMLAKFYGTEANNIKVNHSRNASRFILGKHYFKLEGSELKAFKDWVTKSNSVQISKNARSLILWTERGAARHAKMLDTDQAWDVFEMLEDSYFILKEENREPKTTVADRVPLIHAVATLVATSGHLKYSDAYKLVHQRFGVEHVEQLSHAQVKEAVEYVHMLITACTQIPEETYEQIRKLTESILWQNFIMADVWKALMLICKKDMLYYSNYVINSNVAALEVARTLNFTNKRNVPLISPDFRTISFSTGHALGTNPNWFNAPA